MVPDKSVAPGAQPVRPPRIAGALLAARTRPPCRAAALLLALTLCLLAGALSSASALPFFKRSKAENKENAESHAKAAPALPRTSPAQPEGQFVPTKIPAATGDATQKKKWFSLRWPRKDKANAESSGSDGLSSKTSRWGFRTRELRIPPAPAPSDMASIVRVQVYLDGQNLGPGKIDGALGEFTKKAALYYNQSHGVETGNWGPLLYEANRSVPRLHSIYVIKEDDRRFVGSLPYDPPEQAKKKYMSYRSLREFVEERFHTDGNYLRRANPGRSLDNLKVGDAVNVPNVTPFRIEDIQNHHQFERAELLSRRHIIVDTKEKMAVIQDQGHLVAAFPITPGQERYIPYGNWKIDTMVTTPTFRYDKQMLQEGVRGDDFHMLPPGPNSPVGIFWAGLTKSGIGLHGTNSPETIGRARSSGCIRLANWDAVRLSSLVRPGASVEVR